MNYFKTISIILLLGLLSACSTTTLEQDVTQQPVPTQTVTQANPQTQIPSPQSPDATTQANALAPQPVTTPSQNVAESQLQQPTTAQTQPPSALQQTTTQQVVSLDTSKAITFLPFEGAPQTKTASLKRLLNSTAQSNGLAILPATRAGAKYRVKGYFSALNDGSGTLLVYVWDIVDGTGKRLHRINGRERTGTTKADPWQAITDKEIERVANDTTARLKTWVDKRS